MKSEKGGKETKNRKTKICQPRTAAFFKETQPLKVYEFATFLFPFEEHWP